MASVSFQLIGKNIYSNLSTTSSGKGKTFKKKTGFSTNPDHWKTKASRKKSKNGTYKRKADLTKPSDADGKILKSTLDQLQDAILNQHNTDYSKGIEIDGNWFESSIKKHTNREADDKEFLIYQIQKAIDDAPRKKIPTKGGKYKIGLSKGRTKGIEQFKTIIDRFQNDTYNGTQLKVPNINKETISDFEGWLFAQNYSDNYIGKQLANLKSILNGVEDVKVNIEVKKIKVISEEKEPEDIIYLSFEELEQIKGLKLTTNYLSNARKWLILGCYVGQRASDLLELTPDKIKTIRGRKAFQIKQKKTGKNVTIPILPEAELIIKSGFPYKISDTKLREYFKQVCRIAGIDKPTNGRIKTSKHGTTKKGVYPKWRLIGTHVCRRSFASNHYGETPTVVLKSITGHSTEDMFLSYIGKPPEDLAMQMYNYIEKLPKTKTMEVVKNEKETGTEK